MHAFGKLLMDWYARQGRALPWRATGDPYAILVSEVMLQQTQVSRVVPAYARFLGRFPTVGDLAAAPLAEVLTAWRGLGYNRRARNLHAAARAIVEEHGGVVPADLAALRALPGIGAYTARAVLAFGFDQPVAPVDTNVRRVLARGVAGNALGTAAVQRLADDLVPSGHPATWSHALMDLGATVCTARVAYCAGCPVAGACAWRAAGGPDGSEDPARREVRRASPRAAFSSSDRYHRGRLVDALRDGPVSGPDLARAADCSDSTRLEKLVRALVADGLAEWRGERLMLPGAVA